MILPLLFFFSSRRIVYLFFGSLYLASTSVIFSSIFKFLWTFFLHSRRTAQIYLISLIGFYTASIILSTASSVNFKAVIELKFQQHLYLIIPFYLLQLFFFLYFQIISCHIALHSLNFILVHFNCCLIFQKDFLLYLSTYSLVLVNQFQAQQ